MAGVSKADKIFLEVIDAIKKLSERIRKLESRPALTSTTSSPHSMTGSGHYASGLLVGMTIRATGATTFAWEQLSHTDVGGVLPDQHHTGFIGLKDTALTVVVPDADDYIMIDASSGAVSTSGSDKITITLDWGTPTISTIDPLDTPNAGASTNPARSDHVHGINGMFTPLTSPLTSTSWDGDAHSTTAKTLIDLSAVFGAPAGIKAAVFRTAIRDSASATNDCVLILSPNNSDGVGLSADCSGIANDYYDRNCLTVPCDANGDVYYQIVASGVNTMDVTVEIWGYWL